jgi:hypothetical protein
MKRSPRRAFARADLAVAVALVLVAGALLAPLLGRARAAARKQNDLDTLKKLMLACHVYHDANGALPPGVDDNDLSAAAYLMPYLTNDGEALNPLSKDIDFKKGLDDKANVKARKAVVKLFLSVNDPLKEVTDKYGATNYLFCAGTGYALKDNDGVFYHNSKTRLRDIKDGTSNTMTLGVTLKGDNGKGLDNGSGDGDKKPDVRRHHVRLKAKDLDGLKPDAGVAEFKKARKLAGDRGASWMDGRFLQGTFTATLVPNDPHPDVDCGGKGGLSALRSLDGTIDIGLADGSSRTVRLKKIKIHLWKSLATRAGGEALFEY